MSNLPQDTEESLFNPGLSFFSSDSNGEPSLRDQRSEIRALKSEMTQQGQLLASLSAAQLSQLVDIFSATPSTVPPTPVPSPPSRAGRLSQVFSPTHGTTAIQPGQSITVMSTKLAESAPAPLMNFNLAMTSFYIATRAYSMWIGLLRLGQTRFPLPCALGFMVTSMIDIEYY